MNYGLLSAVLLNKIALQRLHRLAGRIGVPIHPIIGAGSAPFRGNLHPETVDRVAEEYPSVSTFTIQSAFKYDYPSDLVRQAIQRLNAHEPTAPQEVDKERCLEILQCYSRRYAEQTVGLAPLVNRLAKFVPSRRKRKLHIGLFGYSRQMEGVALPRAITFTAALYSVGLPPEVLGPDALTREDLQFVRSTYIHFDADLQDALRYFNPDSPLAPPAVGRRARELALKTDEEHRDIASDLIRAVQDNKTDHAEECVLRAAHMRRFLG